MSAIQPIAINKLIASPKNARKTKASESADAELLGLIRTHGVQHNLVVVPSAKKKDHYEVIDGERRRQALLKLVKEKHLSEEDPIYCKVIDADEAEELSLVLNTARENMHPADEFETFSRLIKKQKLTEEQVAARFGTTVKHVRQRMSLAVVNPRILEVYKAGDITLDVVKAFTLEPDQKKQLAVLQKIALRKNVDAEDVRSELTEDKLDQNSAIVKFVTLKAYQAAGGTITQDLFGDDILINDNELIHKLAMEKLGKAADKMKAKGWKWVTAFINRDGNFEHQHLRIDQIVGSDGDYDPEQMKFAGCTVYIGYNGKLDSTTGLITKADKKAMEKALAPAAPSERKKAKLPEGTQPVQDETQHQDNDAGHADQEPEQEQPVADGMDLPAGLSENLRLEREAIVQLHIAKNAEVARDLLYFAICMEVLPDPERAEDSIDDDANEDYCSQPLDINASTDVRFDSEESKAWREMMDLHKALSLRWYNGNTLKSFEQFCALDSARKQQLMAWCVAQTFVCHLNDGNTKNAITESAIKKLGIKWHEYWRPTVANFFGSITKDALNNIGCQLYASEEDWKQLTRIDNKSRIAKRVEELVREKAPKWMPAGFEAK